MIEPASFIYIGKSTFDWLELRACVCASDPCRQHQKKRNLQQQKKRAYNLIPLYDLIICICRHECHSSYVHKFQRVNDRMNERTGELERTDGESRQLAASRHFFMKILLMKMKNRLIVPLGTWSLVHQKGNRSAKVHRSELPLLWRLLLLLLCQLFAYRSKKGRRKKEGSSQLFIRSRTLPSATDATTAKWQCVFDWIYISDAFKHSREREKGWDSHWFIQRLQQLSSSFKQWDTGLLLARERKEIIAVGHTTTSPRSLLSPNKRRRRRR